MGDVAARRGLGVGPAGRGHGHGSPGHGSPGPLGGRAPQRRCP
uniref:Putative thymidine kinase 2 mitochondrial variant 1 n=1 Tax=Taeniopygia guttata TaxID=59729 RepID=B5FZB8_TAEGU|nr:putative thymidine kinase 2 mitochondrial variant 1 [Taeniopygia guttata]ACH44379.1 putative thymidine kinase 2 mitochondrial variant 1 [Taeniopygia guttata]